MNDRKKIKKLIIGILVTVVALHTVEFIVDDVHRWIHLLDNVLSTLGLLLVLYFYRRMVDQKQDSEIQLRSVLDTAAEGIYGLDQEGKCTFANRSCLDILGYDEEEELLGRNMHELIHHTRENGEHYPKEDCQIVKEVRRGYYVHNDQEVFWKKDGSFFHAEFRSKPLKLGEEIVGSVVSFADISARRKQEEELRYLSFHDPVTGLYNKVFAYEEIARLDVERNLPFSVIVGDVNGLKLANDVFGHEAGDALLMKIGQSIKKSVRRDDIVARTGGDEFLILLPKTSAQDAEMLLRRMLDEVKEDTRDTISSISLGTATKGAMEENFFRVMKEAEDKMYHYKSLHHSKNQRSTLDQIMENLFEKSPKEKSHSEQVSLLAERIAVKMHLPFEEVRRVKEAAYYHDVGKIALNEKTLNRLGDLDGADLEEMKRHTVIGYRILNLFSDTMDLSRGALEHHELYDGSGYPKQLKGSEISLMGRIISVAEAYEFFAHGSSSEERSDEHAVQCILDQRGRKYDSSVVDAFVAVMAGKVPKNKLENSPAG